MASEVFIAVVTALITAGGLALVAKINTKSGNAASTVESALKLQTRYEEINTNLTRDMNIMKDDFNQKIKLLTKEFQQEMKDIKQQFEEKENYYKSELEKKDDRIDELETENTTLRIENANLKGVI